MTETKYEKLFGYTTLVISLGVIFFTGWPTAHETFHPHHHDYVIQSLQHQ